MSLNSQSTNRHLLCKRYVSALAVAVAIFLLGLFGINRMLNEFRSGPPATGKRTGIGELVGTSQVCQTFLSEYSQLAQVEVAFATFDRQNIGTLIFVLHSAQGAPQDIVTLSLDISQIKDNKYHSFVFPPRADSAGKTYVFCLEAPDVDLASAITPIGILQDVYPDGQASFRDMWGESAGVQDLDFRIGYTFSFSQKPGVLADRITRYKPFLCGDWRFYVLLVIVYLVLLYGLFFKLDDVR